MRFTVHGDDVLGDAERTRLLFVMGWGNTPDQAPVAWLLSELVDAGYVVHAAEIPTNVTSFEAEYLRPVARYARERGFDRLLAHSTGGLVVPFLRTDARRVYLSPWWGVRSGVQSALLPRFARLPTSRRLLPTSVDPEALGAYADPRADRDPGGLSPTFAREILRAQRSLPTFREGSVVFCSLSDRVVSVRAVGDRAPARNVRLYDGGHEFFASRNRADILTDVTAALDRGPEAL